MGDNQELRTKSIYMQIIATSEAFLKGHFKEGINCAWADNLLRFVRLSIIPCAWAYLMWRESLKAEKF